jgi:hypothetical protein
MEIDIPYEPDSFANSFSEQEFTKFEAYLARDAAGFHFDPAYTEHLKSYHGGVPVKKFVSTKAGSTRRIERFLNFVDTHAERNAAYAQYNVNVVWSNIEDRLGPYLVPFVELSGGDFLCFDFADPSRQSVVLWSHELSNEDEPYTEPVADSFVDFLSMLA